jgi:hypothetical protein
MSLQRTYDINPERGFPGQLAEPNSAHRIVEGTLTVPTGATRANPRPGDAVYYLASANAWQVPVNAGDQLAVGGILTYRADAVQNVSSILQFSDGDQIFIVTMGVVWLIAGGASNNGDIMVMQIDDWKYDSTARVTAIADMYEKPIEQYANMDTVDNQIFKGAIGYGRAI